MLKRFLTIALLLLGGNPAFAQTAGSFAKAVATCGAQTLTAGVTYPITQDLTGTLCTPGGGGGSVGSVTQGTVPWVVSNAGTFPVQATLSAETTKVIGTVNQGTSPWVVSGAVSVTQTTSPWVVSGSVNATLSAETTKVIGTVNQGTSPWVVSGSVTASGTVAATQSGTWTVQPGNTANTTAWLTNTPAADPCQSNTATYTPISITSATTTRIVAPTSAKKTYICYLFMISAIANNIAVVEGTGGTCGASTAGVVGGTTAANGLNLAANSGAVFQAGGNAAVATAGTNVDLCLITSAAGPLAGHIKWVQAP